MSGIEARARAYAEKYFSSPVARMAGFGAYKDGARAEVELERKRIGHEVERMFGPNWRNDPTAEELKKIIEGA